MNQKKLFEFNENFLMKRKSRFNNYDYIHISTIH